MRLTGSRAYSRPAPVPKMPLGLVELMEGLTKDVLKHNPPDIYEFCANHVQALLEIRDGPTSKRSSSLEQKITRAQEKVRRRAEDRWQKYLKEIQESTSANKQISQNNQEISVTEEVHNSKLPIHHDLNLANVSEVEIFHDPLKNIVNVENVANSLEISKSDKPKQEDITEITYKTDLDVDSLNDTPHTLSREDINAETNENMEMLNVKVNNLNSIESERFTRSTNANAEENNVNVEQFAVQTIHEEPEIELSSAPSIIPQNNNKDTESQGQYKNMNPGNFSLSDFNGQIPVIGNISEYKEVELINRNSVLSIIEEKETEGNILNHVEELLDKSKNDKKENNFDDNDFKKEMLIVDQPKDSAKQQEYEVNNERVTENVENISYIKSQDQVLEPTVTGQNIEISNDNKINDQVLEQSDILLDKTQVKNDDVSENETVKPGDIDKEIIETVTPKEIQDMASESKKSNENNKNLSKDETHALNDFIDKSNELISENNSEVEDNTNENINNKKIIESEITDNIQAEKSIMKHNEHTYDSVDQFEIRDNSKVIDTQLISEIEYEVTKSNEFLSPGQDLENQECDFKTKNNNGTSNNNKIIIPISDTSDENITSHISKEDIKEELSTTKNLAIDKAIESSVSDNSLQPEFTNNDTNNVERNIITNSDDENSVENYNNVNKDSVILENCEDINQKGTTNPNNMDLETAAITIQKVFRSFLFKSRASTLDDTNEENNSLEDDNSKKEETEYPVLNANLNKERRGITRMDTVLQTVNEEKSLSSTDDSSLSSAATTIQAHVRGFLVRNRLHSNKTSTNSLANSDGTSTMSLDGDVENNKNKTILNIHIVPEGGNYLSRDESMLTSMDISLDGSPPSSLNLHPLGYDRNERKQLKREDAIQSISPPSNNSGKLSEDVDSVKEMLINDAEVSSLQKNKDKNVPELEQNETEPQIIYTLPSNSTTIETLVESHKVDDGENINSSHLTSRNTDEKPKGTLTKMNSDEMDVVTPFQENPSDIKSDSNSPSKLMHSSEFHDIVLPTKVSRSDTSVVSEFKSVLVYFLLWNNS